MLLVAVYLRGRLLYLEGVSAVGALIAIALLERAGVLPHHNIIPDFPPDLHKNTAFVTGQLSFVALTAIAIPYLTAVIKARLSAAECKILVLEQTSHAISSMLSQPEFLNHLAHSAAEALSVPYASIRLLDETGEHLALAATYGLSQAYLAKGPVTLSRSEIDREALAGRPVIVHDVSSDPRVQYPTQMTREGIRSLLDVPIIGRGKPLGVLRVYSNRPHRFTPLDVDYVTAIARQSATALEYAVTCQGLQNSEETRAHFVRMVTHELRSPVSGAQSLVRTLLHSRGAELNPQQRDIVTRIEARLDLLMALIDDLLALAASKTVGQEEQLEGILLQPVLEQVIGRLTPEAEAKQIRLNLDAPVRVLAVHATEEGLARVFINLIGNAIKYTPAGGRVDVTVVERLGTAGVSVADTGIGIPRADLPHLWEEFFRAGNAKRSGIKGTGLGLSIVKQLVDHFGGLIEVHSVEGEGTTFNVTLPLDRLPLVNPADGHSAQIA
jgi:signal transduction histidine kinase